MNIQLQSYLYSKFPELFPTEPKIQCKDGWFHLILWSCRYITIYIENYNSTNKSNSLKTPEILQIKNEDGLLKMKIENSVKAIDDYLQTINFISGYICEISGRITNNVINLQTKQILNEEFIDVTVPHQYVDCEYLRNILSEVNKN
jgi:hypothetical protein